MLGSIRERLIVSPGPRRPHALGDLDVAVLERRALDQAGQYGVTIAFPPGDFGLDVGRGVEANWPGTSTDGCSTGVVHPASTSANNAINLG